MCGIAGFLGNFDPLLLGRMNTLLAHRGPDGDGEWHDSTCGVGFTHRRLAIIDLSERGLQPMWDVSRKAVITYNGEIYNYQELRAELEDDGYKFHSACDTEVILNLYLRDGCGAIPRLNGIFAFALWDVSARQLVLARDAQGVKPLYYAHTPSGLVFASELKALMCVPDLDKTLDVRAITHYLGFLYAPSPGTMLQSVRKLPPGHYMTVRSGGPPVVKRHASPAYEQPISRMSAEEAIAQTRYFLQEAVRRQMVADVPVGAFLSGGLDSSSVVTFSRQHAQDGRLKCFTIGNRNGWGAEEGWVDDLPYAQKAATHLGVDLHTIWVGPEMAERFAWMVGQLDEPQADPAALNAYFIAKLARENGIKVLLSGAGGDDIFSGYRRHYAVQLERYWSWLPQGARRMLANRAQALPKSHPALRRTSKAFQFADKDTDARIAGAFLWLNPESIHSVLSEESRRNLGGHDVLQPMLEALAGLPPATSRLNRTLHLDALFFLADHNLNYTDKMSMATGVEVRVPFLDPDLVSFAARLPIGYKQNGAEGKWILKKAMEPWLPEEVIYRPKVGFGVPLRRWMQNELREHVDDTLSTAALAKRGIFDPDNVHKLVELDREGRMDASYPIFAIMCIETWCRHFLDRNTA